MSFMQVYQNSIKFNEHVNGFCKFIISFKPNGSYLVVVLFTYKYLYECKLILEIYIEYQMTKCE